MPDETIGFACIDREELRRRVAEKYRDVALRPEIGFHFHTGRPLAAMLGYSPALIDSLPEDVVSSFAGTGNPFLCSELALGATVVDVGCGAGFDTLIAAQQVGPAGHVIGVDMTPEMRAKAERAARALGLHNVEIRAGYAEALPIPDISADVVISNGVINLCPDKLQALREMWRALKPRGRLQIADVIVHRPVPQEAKEDIDLWSG